MEPAPQYRRHIKTGTTLQVTALVTTAALLSVLIIASLVALTVDQCFKDPAFRTQWTTKPPGGDAFNPATTVRYPLEI